MSESPTIEETSDATHVSTKSTGSSRSAASATSTSSKSMVSSEASSESSLRLAATKEATESSLEPTNDVDLPPSKTTSSDPGSKSPSSSDTAVNPRAQEGKEGAVEEKQKKRKKTPPPNIDSEVKPKKEEEAEKEEEEELKYGAEHAIMLFVPISLSMAAVVAGVRSVPYYTKKDAYLIYTPYHEETDDTSTKLWQSLANVAIILCAIILSTFFLFLLVRFKLYALIYGWLIFSMFLLLYFLSLIFLVKILDVYNVPMDWMSVIVLIWNFGAVGMICIFWKGPLMLQQLYLITCSALVALVFIKFMPDWTLWCLLAVLVVWDLVAVLCPYGPLRMLVELLEERGDKTFLPGIIYSSMLWDTNLKSEKYKNKNWNHRNSHSPMKNTNRNADESERLNSKLSSTKPQLSDSNVATIQSENVATLQSENVGTIQSENVATVQSENVATTQIENAASQDSSAALQDPKSTGSRSSSEENTKSIPEKPQQKQQKQKKKTKKKKQADGDQEEEDNGIKLGLGDFIFYSVLVGKASTHGDWNTTIACFVSILIGLCSTLLLLAIYKKALPALPISITFGLVFYFSTSLVVVPFTSALAAQQIYI